MADELVTARQKYAKTREKVLNKVQSRRSAVAETITDLREEDEALAKVEAEAQSA